MRVGNLFKVSCIAITAILFSSNSILQAQLVPQNVSVETQRNNATELALKEVVSLNFDEDSFKDVQLTLEKMTELNFVLSDSAKDDRLTDDELITFYLQNVPLNKAIEVLLKPYNATYYIDDGIVTVISHDVRYEEFALRTKMFDCRQLIEKMRTPVLTRRSGGGNSGGGISGGGISGGSASGDGGENVGSTKGGGGVFSIPSQPRSSPQVEVLFGSEPSGWQSRPQEQAELTSEQIFDGKCELLVDTIKGAIGPDSWSDTGGICQIKFVDGILIVSQAEFELRKIESLLVDLHAQMGLKFADQQVATAKSGKQVEGAAKMSANVDKVKGNPFSNGPRNTEKAESKARRPKNRDPFQGG